MAKQAEGSSVNPKESSRPAEPGATRVVSSDMPLSYIQRASGAPTKESLQFFKQDQRDRRER